MAVRHYHNHFRFSYPTSLRRHFFSLLLVLFFTVIAFLLIGKAFLPQPDTRLEEISPLLILDASSNTLLRLAIAYILSLMFSIPAALAITHSENLEKILLPIVDIIQSIPVLAFFPVIVLAFVKFNLLDGAAIFILFISMTWSILFSMVGGIKTIPEDIHEAAKVFGAKGIKKTLYVILPSIFPSIITGSFLAWGAGWNISIVAEALHSFIPNGSRSQDLLGLGSLLVNAFYDSKNSVFLVSLTTMILIITFLNFFVWQKLLHLAERYKFD